MAEKVPFATDEQLRDLAERYGTPFHLYDEATIRRRAHALKAAFAWCGEGGFREHFAVKACPNPAIIGILADEGFGVDCATGVELMIAEACGLAGGDIMFSSNETPDADYRAAHALGATTNLDDLTQVDHYLRACGSFAGRMSVRLNPGGTIAAATGIQGEPESSKFGMRPDQAKEALRRLAGSGVRELGVHSFLSSNSLDEGYFGRLAGLLLRFAAEVEDELGIRLGFVNLSGGVGVAYRPDQEPVDIMRVGEGVRRAFEEAGVAAAGASGVRVACELGRWMLAPAGGLVTRVIGTKSTYREFLGVDACSSDLMRPMIYDAYHHVTVVGRRDEAADHTYDVVGGLCEGTDKLAHDRALPGAHEGDLLFVHDTGAHGHAMGYQYNGKLRHAEVLLREDGTSELIRRAETPADYFATLGCTEAGRRLLGMGGAGKLVRH